MSKIVKIKELDNIPENELLNKIRLSIADICMKKGENIKFIAQKFYGRYNSKDERTKMGMIAEFLIHLVLKEEGFKQNFRFFNLEENSIKKGFDGLYSYKKELWYMESKSTKKDNNPMNDKHYGNVQTASVDIKNKFNGTKKNPWENAANHASRRRSKKSIKKFLEEMDRKHTAGIFLDLSDTNIIPASTVYFIDEEKDLDKNNLENQVINYLNNHHNEFKKIIVVCNSISSYEVITAFIEGVINE